MTKQDKIKEVYGEDYERIKYYIDGDGWLDGRPCDNELSRVYNNIFDDCDRKFDSIRPKSLKGIENNNGWIKIESQTDNPKDDGNYYVVYDGKSIGIQCYYGNGSWDCHLNITHYQPIVQPRPPIY